MTTDQTTFEIERLLPWHRPQVRYLAVSLDTQFVQKEGSFVDGQDFPTTVEPDGA